MRPREIDFHMQGPLEHRLYHFKRICVFLAGSKISQSVIPRRRKIKLCAWTWQPVNLLSRILGQFLYPSFFLPVWLSASFLFNRPFSRQCDTSENSIETLHASQNFDIDAITSGLPYSLCLRRASIDTLSEKNFCRTVLKRYFESHYGSSLLSITFHWRLWWK